MHKLFACYERGSTGWMLVIYHDSKPGKPVGAQAPDRTPFFDVPQEFIGTDGTPNMGMIQKAFPAPLPEGYSEAPLTLNQEKEVDTSAAWYKFRGDFNAMTDEEIEKETSRSQETVDHEEEWLEAVASWKNAGKPRSSNDGQ